MRETTATSLTDKMFLPKPTGFISYVHQRRSLGKSSSSVWKSRKWLSRNNKGSNKKRTSRTKLELQNASSGNSHQPVFAATNSSSSTEPEPTTDRRSLHTQHSCGFRWFRFVLRFMQIVFRIFPQLVNLCVIFFAQILSAKSHIL